MPDLFDAIRNSGMGVSQVSPNQWIIQPNPAEDSEMPYFSDDDDERLNAVIDSGLYNNGINSLYIKMPQLAPWGGYTSADMDEPIPENLLNAPGMVAPSTIDPRSARIYQGMFPDGTKNWGTVYSATRRLPNGQYMVYPTILDHLNENGEMEYSPMDSEDAFLRALDTGRYMGIFDTRENADNYAKNYSAYHNQRFGPMAESMTPLWDRIFNAVFGQLEPVPTTPEERYNSIMAQWPYLDQRAVRNFVDMTSTGR